MSLQRSVFAATKYRDFWKVHRKLKQLHSSANALEKHWRVEDEERRALGQLCTQFKRYARENNAEFAARLYDEYQARGGEPQLWMTNLLLGTYARRHEGDKAWDLYQRLLAAGVPAPNLFTYAAVLNALAKSGHPPYNLQPEAAQRGEAVLVHLRAAGLTPNQVVFHSLMDVQAKAAAPDAALRTLRDMQAAGLAPSAQTFALLVTACARAGQRGRALEVVERLMPAAGVAPDASVWNALLGAHATAGSVDAAYAAWLAMLGSGVAPDAFTERKLAEAFASHPALAAEVVAEARAARRRHEAAARAAAEAAAAAAERRAAEEAEVPGEWRGGGSATLAEMAEQAVRQAAAAGKSDEGDDDGAGRQLRRPPPRLRSMRQPPLLVDTLEAPSAAALMWEDDEAGARAAAEEAAGGGGGGGGPAPRAEAGAGLTRLLWLDLHGTSQAAARMSVLRRLEVLVSVGPALSAAVEARRKQGSGGGSWRGDGELLEERQPSGPQPPGGQQRQCQQRHRPWEDGLVVVTGVGLHSRADAPGVLRVAVAELLAAQGLPAAPDPSNPGRLRVPWPALAAFIAAQREGMRRDHLWAVMRARALYVVAGAAGLVSAAVLVPRLAPWLG